MTLPTIIAPTLDENALYRGQIKINPAKVVLNISDLDFIEDSNTELALSESDARDLLRELPKVVKRIAEINTRLPTAKLNASVEDFREAWIQVMKLQLELSNRDPNEFERLWANEEVYFKGALYTFSKKPGKDWIIKQGWSTS